MKLVSSDIKITDSLFHEIKISVYESQVVILSCSFNWFQSPMFFKDSIIDIEDSFFEDNLNGEICILNS